MSKDKDDKGYSHRYYGRMFPAIIMIVIGTVFLLSNFDILPKDAIGKFWPVFIIIPGLFMLFAPRK